MFATKTGITKLYEEIDTDKDNQVSEEELETYIYNNFIKNDANIKLLAIKSPKNDDDDEEDEEHEMPEEFLELDPSVRVTRIINRSLQMMFFGTLVVLIFSDPMVDVLGRFGELTHIESFFVSFIMAPLASNAPEILASIS